MIGERHPHFEFLQSLSKKCLFNIFSSEHVRCILEHISSNRVGNKHLEVSSFDLLLVRTMLLMRVIVQIAFHIKCFKFDQLVAIDVRNVISTPCVLIYLHSFQACLASVDCILGITKISGFVGSNKFSWLHLFFAQM